MCGYSLSSYTATSVSINLWDANKQITSVHTHQTGIHMAITVTSTEHLRMELQVDVLVFMPL